MIATDFKVHIFNESLIIIRSLFLKSRLIQQIDFINDSDTMIASGVEGVFFYNFSYSGYTNVKQQHEMDPLGTRVNISL